MDASKIWSHENVLSAPQELDAQSDASSATFHEVSSPIQTVPDSRKGRAAKPRNDIEKANSGVDAVSHSNSMDAQRTATVRHQADTS